MRKIFAKIFLLTIGIIISVFSIEPEVRNQFKSIVSGGLYTPALSYDLDLPFSEMSSAYNNHMNCLFHEAIIYSRDSTKQYFVSILQDKNIEFSPTSTPPLSQNCLQLSDVFARQYLLGHRSSCDTENSFEENIYSPCRIAELAWNEWGAYQEYLSWKKRDTGEGGSLWKEFANTSSDFNVNTINQYIKDVQSKISVEIELSEVLLRESLRRFFLESFYYWNSFWVNALGFGFNNTRNEFILFNQNIATFPAKFHNSTAEN